MKNTFVLDEGILLSAHTGENEQGDLDLAIAEYEEAIKIRPSHAYAHFNLALAYQAQARLQEAIAYYEKFIELAPPEYAADLRHAEETINQIREANGEHPE